MCSGHGSTITIYLFLLLNPRVTCFHASLLEIAVLSLSCHCFYSFVVKGGGDWHFGALHENVLGQEQQRQQVKLVGLCVEVDGVDQPVVVIV